MKNGSKESGRVLGGIRFYLSIMLRDEPLLVLLILACIVSSVLMSLAMVYLPSVAVSVVEANVEPRDATMLIFVAVAVVLLHVVEGVSYGAKGYKQLFLGRKAVCDIFLRRFEHTFQYVESAEGQQSYEKARQICRWAVEFRTTVEGMINLSVCVASFVIFSGILSQLSIYFTFFLLGLSLVNYFSLRYMSKADAARRQIQAADYRQITYLNNISQSVRAGKDIRMFNMSGKIEKLIDASLAKLSLSRRKFESAAAVADTTEAITGFIRDAVAYSYLIYMVFNGIALHEFVLYLGVIAQFSSFVNEFVRSFNKLKAGNNAMAEVCAYMEHDSGAFEPIHASHQAELKSARVEFRNVCFSYEDDGPCIVDGLNLTIEDGENVAIVGLNGAGKTTMVKLICGLYKPTSGGIYIDGVNVGDIDAKTLSNHIAVVFQDSIVLPYSIAENISMKSIEDTDFDLAWDCLMQAGLYDYVKSLPNQIRTEVTRAVDENGIMLSGGQLQKIYMARALYHSSAKLMIFDEPTAALDAVAESETYEQFHRASKGHTCLYISHRLASTRFLDRIVVLSQGRIVEVGTHEELIKHGGIYAEMYKLQSRYYKDGNDGCLQSTQ